MINKPWIVIAGASVIAVLFIFIGWWRSQPTEKQIFIPKPSETAGMNDAFTLQSSVFSSGKPIPSVYTCDGTNARPPLSITGVPEDSKSLAIIMYDPDAPGGTFVHWVAWNIPPGTKELPAGPLPAGIVEGTNSFRSMGYQGPCPPSGTHRYIWRLYALRSVLSLDTKTTREDLESAMNTYVITQTELMGIYTKQ